MTSLPAPVSAARLRDALAGLLEKYAVSPPPDWTLQARFDETAGPHAMAPGWTALDHPLPAGGVPLLPWRSERRMIELKKLVEGEVVTPVCMARFACHTDGAMLGLDAILYREFDLAEWLLGSPVQAVSTSITGPVAHAIVRLASGVVCGVEASAGLPTGAAMIDRHELIAQRGVACDRVVDTQVPQDSVYLLTPQGTSRYTDTDAELFGLETDEVLLVRAAYDTLTRPAQAETLRQQHRRLAALVRLAREADRRGARLTVEGGWS